MADRTGTFYSAEGVQQGYATQLMVGDGGSPEAFEAVFGVKSIKPGEISTKDIDRTHLRSLARHMEHSPGMRDSGPIEFEGVYKANEQSLSMAGGGSGAFATGGLPAMHEDSVIRNFKIIASDNTAVIVRGYVAGFSLGEINNDGDWTYSGSVQPTEAYDHP